MARGSLDNENWQRINAAVAAAAVAEPAPRASVKVDEVHAAPRCVLALADRAGQVLRPQLLAVHRPVAAARRRSVTDTEVFTHPDIVGPVVVKKRPRAKSPIKTEDRTMTINLKALAVVITVASAMDAALLTTTVEGFSISPLARYLATIAQAGFTAALLFLPGLGVGGRRPPSQGNHAL